MSKCRKTKQTPLFNVLEQPLATIILLALQYYFLYDFISRSHHSGGILGCSFSLCCFISLWFAGFRCKSQMHSYHILRSGQVRLRSNVWTTAASWFFSFFIHYVLEFCCCGLDHCFGQTCHADGFTFDSRILWYQEEHNNCKVSKSCGCKTNQTHQPWYWCCADFLCTVRYGQMCILFQKSRGLFR